MATSITTRAAKGSRLTHVEVDNNFLNLRTTADAALPAAAAVPVTLFKDNPTVFDEITIYDAANGGAPRQAFLGDLPAFNGNGAAVPVIVMHDGAGEVPETGDTLTVVFATGWSGSVQWLRDGSDIGGATSASYTLVEADEFLPIRPRITNLVFTGESFTPTPAGATIPDAFEIGDWSVTPIEAGLRFTLNNPLPNNGGSAVTDIEFSLNDGATWASLGGTTHGNYDVTPLGIEEYENKVRLVNAIGPGPDSDMKAETPDAVPGNEQWVAAGPKYEQFSGTTHNLVVPQDAGVQVGDMLIAVFNPFGTFTGVATNGSTPQNLNLLATYASAGEVGRVYGVVITGEVPENVVVTRSESGDVLGQVFVARGVTQVAGTVLDANVVSEARTSLPYNTDAAKALILHLFTTTGSITRNVATAAYPGDGSIDLASRWEFSAQGIIAGVHDGSTGANTVAVTWNSSDADGGRCLAVALKA